MPEQTPPPADVPPAPAPSPAAPPEKQPPWGTAEDFNPDKAWELIQKLREDKAQKGASNEALAQRLAEMEKSAVPRDALAAALGLKPESMTEAEKVTEQLAALQAQVIATEKRALAAEFKIPEQYHHMLTATDAEGLRKQAADLVSFAEAAHVAALSTLPPPAFQPHPGQGQGGGALTPEAQAVAEYEKFYPSK